MAEGVDKDAETEAWHATLEEVHATLLDPQAPPEARIDAALRCWKLAEHDDKVVEFRRQNLVASHGGYPRLAGILVDAIAQEGAGEEFIWRGLRALIQLAYDNPAVAFQILQNSIKQARDMAKQEDSVLATLREAAKKDVAGVDEQLKQTLLESRDRIAGLRARQSTPAELMGLVDRSREVGVSGRVMECIFHLLNNLANSCWDAHDVILKDKTLDRALALLVAKSTPDYVVAAVVGFLTSLSQRRASRPPMLKANVLEALRPIILLSSPAVNSIAAVLTAANLSGEHPAEKCPAVTAEQQVGAKTVSALHAFVGRVSFAGRFGTVWKVASTVAGLCRQRRNHAMMLANAVPALMVKILQGEHLHPVAQESCCTVLLLLAHETSSRSAILADAPEAEAALHQVCQTGMTATARAASEAALWALGHLETPAWGGAHPRPVHNNVMISHHITHLRHAEGLGQAFAGEHRRWAHTGTQGLSNIEAGIRHCTVMIVLLSEEYQASPFCRAEVTAAVALEKPILWIHAAGSTLPPPNDWVRKLADKKQPPIRSRDYGDMKLGRLEFDSMSGTLLPRETFDALFKTVMGKIEVFFPQMDTQAVVQEEEEETVPEDVREVVDWTAKEVGEWVIHSLRLGEYADAFVANSVDGMLLLELDDDDLEHSLRVEDAGHRDKILAAVRFILEHATTAKRT